MALQQYNRQIQQYAGPASAVAGAMAAVTNAEFNNILRRSVQSFADRAANYWSTQHSVQPSTTNIRNENDSGYKRHANTQSTGTRQPKSGILHVPGHSTNAVRVAPQQPLVGVESNPGPNNRNRKPKTKQQGGKQTAGIIPSGRTVGSPKTTFLAANFKGTHGLKIRGHQKWLTVGNPTGTASANLFADPDGNTQSTIYWDPSNAHMINGVIASLADCFQKFRLISLTLHYLPSTTSTNTALGAVIGWEQDGGGPAVLSGGTNTAFYVTSLENSKEFAVWQPWSMKCNVDSDKLLYTYNDLTAGVTSSSTAKRNQTAGQLLGAFLSNAPANVSYGSIWMDFEVEFYHLANNTGYI